MPTIDDLKHFGPFIVIAICALVGKAMKGARSVPDWMIPPVLTALGLVSGVATALALGGDWRAWLAGALASLAGPAAVGLHQTGRAIARQSTNTPETVVPVVLVPPLPRNDAAAPVIITDHEEPLQ
ncbi:MAG TPA: phage holin family protein [Vicinamibacterales bacterium]|nr:phage holin family protein [Vicinamibacterales bacterium]